MLHLALIAALAAGNEPHPVQTPWYLPRYATAGLMINADIVAPMVRLGWEFTFFNEPRNQLAVFLEAGPSFAVAHPAVVTLFWEHVALGGLDYRWGRDGGFQWGFQIGGGAVLEGPKFSAGVGNPPVTGEQRVLGYVEGRAFAGGRAGPLILALAVGYGSSVNQNPYFISAGWVGGFTVGLWVNWR